MNVKEKLLPLLKYLNESHSLNTLEECFEYVAKIHEAINNIPEIKTSFETRCTYCTHYSVCEIRRANEKFISYVDTLKIAWICSKFKKEAGKE